MTVPSTVNRVSYACDGLTNAFPYPFKIFQEEDLLVILRSAAGVETTLSLAADYAVSGAGSDAGGNVTTVATYAAGNTLLLKRQLDILQETDYINGSAFNAESHEDALDRGIMISQQLDEELGRTLKVKISSSVTGLEVPDPAANKYLKWNAGATALENADLVALGDLTAHANSASPHAQWYANNTATGPVILATAADAAAGSNASKAMTPAALAALWQYEELFVPAGAFVSPSTNGATLSSQGYPLSYDKVDYAEFGWSANEEAILFRVAFPRTWDQATLKAKPVWMAPYGGAMGAGASVAIGFQAKPWNDASGIDVNWGSPPVYVTDAVMNVATGTQHVGYASANFATAIAGSDNFLSIRVTRKNLGVTTNATRPMWLTGVLLQIRKLSQAVGW